MSKPKDTIEQFRQKLFEKKKEELIQDAQEKLSATFDNVVYDVIQDPSTKSRKYFMVRIKYDINTKEAVVTHVNDFEEKTVALSIMMDKENRKYLFEKTKKGKK